MRFTELELENVRCYESAAVDLEPGVTVVFGPNGSGKTTLLEACFFAMYGSRALEGTLETFLTTGAEEARVTLAFEHEGTTYEIDRELKYRGDRPTTTSCVLETPDGPIEGATDVREYVASLLRMDAEAFVNCAYVRQGEVNKLIHATPAERQDTIDELLQLGILEIYRDRAGDARLAVEDIRSELTGKLEEITETIEEREARNPHERLNEIQGQLNTVTEEITNIEDNIEEAKETKSDAETILEEYEEKRAERADLNESINALEDKIAATREERAELQTELSDLRKDRQSREQERADLMATIEAEIEADLDSPDAVEAAITDCQDEDEEYRERLESLRLSIQEQRNTIETAQERRHEHQSVAETKREQVTELEAEIEDDEAALKDRRAKLSELKDRRAELQAAFDAAPVERSAIEAHRDELEAELDEHKEKRSSLRADRETVSDKIDHVESLLEAGKCPECEQPIEDAPPVEQLEEFQDRRTELDESIESVADTIGALEERIEEAEELCETKREIDRIEERIDSVETLLDERESALTDKRDRLAELREEITEHEEAATEQATTIETANEEIERLRGDIATCNEKRQAVTERLETLESIQDCDDAIDRLEDTMSALTEQRELLAEQNEERRETLADYRERKQSIEADFDEDQVQQAREDRNRAHDYLEKAQEELKSKIEARDDLQAQIGGIENELEELASLRERKEELTARAEALDSLHGEASDLEAMYGDLRHELRQQNVTTLETMLNDTFDLVYRNDAYDRIELTGEYELSVYQKDGTVLDPAQLSGGERALFNLSLRTAIYRLLAEGIDGAAPMPPLILDEPTVFLDTGHVSQLVSLIESMREIGVEQIVVVSHDEELIDAATRLIQVEKDPTTNRSQVISGAAPGGLVQSLSAASRNR